MSADSYCTLHTVANRCWFVAIQTKSNKAHFSEHMVIVNFQKLRLNCKIKIFYTTGTQKKSNCFRVDGFCDHLSIIFEAVGCFYLFCGCQEVQPGLNDEDIVKGQKKKELDKLRWPYLREMYLIVAMSEVGWKQKHRENHDIKSSVRSAFPLRRQLPTIFRKDDSFPPGHWGVQGRVSRKKTADLTSRNVDVEFLPYKGNDYYTTF